MKGNFQIIIIIVFIAAAVLGVLVFAGAIPLGNSNKTQTTATLGSVTLWGAVPAGAIGKPLDNFNKANPTFIVNYVQVNTDNLDQKLLEAAASGQTPDMLLLTDDLILSYKDKIKTIPYASYPLANFKNNFVSAADVFLTSGGMLAFPLSLDPLMMYYNRSILDQNDIIYPPTYWDELVKLIPVLNKKSDAGNGLSLSTVALGQFSNVTNAKDILATMFMQAGSPIVSENNGYFSSALNSGTLAPILSSYIGFSDPSSPTYSWNRGLPNSTSAFSSEKLIFYFGHASELASLLNRNPNENFLVAPFPQLRGTPSKFTSARVTGVSVLSSSRNINTAFTAATLMSTGTFAKDFADAASVVPVRRDLLTQKPTDAYAPIFYDSALTAKAWLSPKPVNTNDIFKNLIEGVISGNMTVGSAIGDASAKLDLLLRR